MINKFKNINMTKYWNLGKFFTGSVKIKHNHCVPNIILVLYEMTTWKTCFIFCINLHDIELICILCGYLKYYIEIWSIVSTMKYILKLK